MKPVRTSITDARAIFGAGMLGPDDVARVLGLPPGVLPAGRDDLDSVPFARDDLRRAQARGETLVFRTDRDGEAPLTLARIVERFPEALRSSLRSGVGYQLKDEWTVLQEPFAARDVCQPGWWIVHGAVVPGTCNRTYEQQEAALRTYAEGLESGIALARRRAIEAVYDTILFQRAHGSRLLAHAWDWSATPTQDGGYVTVGQFHEDGLHIVGYSRAVRFGTLGVCPQRTGR
jgi:hypothetical protein